MQSYCLYSDQTPKNAPPKQVQTEQTTACILDQGPLVLLPELRRYRLRQQNNYLVSMTQSLVSPINWQFLLSR